MCEIPVGMQSVIERGSMAKAHGLNVLKTELLESRVLLSLPISFKLKKKKITGFSETVLDLLSLN